MAADSPPPHPDMDEPAPHLPIASDHTTPCYDGCDTCADVLLAGVVPRGYARIPHHKKWAFQCLVCGDSGGYSGNVCHLPRCEHHDPVAAKRTCARKMRQVPMAYHKASVTAASFAAVAFDEAAFIRDYVACSVCMDSFPKKRCGRCKTKRYCSKACQRMDWPIHRAACFVLP